MSKVHPKEVDSHSALAYPELRSRHVVSVQRLGCRKMQWEFCIDSARKQLEPHGWQGTWDEPRNVENGKPLIFRWMPCRKMRSKELSTLFSTRDFSRLFPVVFRLRGRGMLSLHGAKLFTHPRFGSENDVQKWRYELCQRKNWRNRFSKNYPKNFPSIRIESWRFCLLTFKFVGLASNASSSMSVACIVSASMFCCVFASSPFRSSHLPVSAGALRPCIAETCRADEVLTQRTKFTTATTRRARSDQRDRHIRPSRNQKQKHHRHRRSIWHGWSFTVKGYMMNEFAWSENLKGYDSWHNAVSIEVVRGFTNENGAIFSFTFPLAAPCRVFWLPMRCQNPKLVRRVCFTSSLQKHHGCRGCCPWRSLIVAWERSPKCQNASKWFKCAKVLDPSARR